MIVRPKRHLDGEIRFHYGDFLAIECEVINPPSARGRSVSVFLDVDDVTKLLLELRSAATRHRSGTSNAVRWPEPVDPLDELWGTINEHLA